MSDPDMVAKVAKALYYKLELEGQTLAPGDHWLGLQRSQKRPWMEAARVAIEAMRNREDDMSYRKNEIDAKIAQMDILIEAYLTIAYAPFFDGSGIREAAIKIRAMRWGAPIDAALSGKE